MLTQIAMLTALFQPFSWLSKGKKEDNSPRIYSTSADAKIEEVPVSDVFASNYVSEWYCLYQNKEHKK